MENNCSVTTMSVYETPLGNIPIDIDSFVAFFLHLFYFKFVFIFYYSLKKFLFLLQHQLLNNSLTLGLFQK